MARASTAAAASAALLLAAACALLFAPAPAAAEAYEWTVYRNNVKAMTAPGVKGTFGDKLGEFLDYKFTLPIEFMRRAQSYAGPRTRLRRVVNDMLSGKKVEINVLGGSISAGAVASRKMAAVDPNDVWNLVRIELQTHLSPKVNFYNNARSATKSYVTSICLDRFLNSTADLVFVEFIANDGSEMDTQLMGPQEKTRSFERFLRKIQKQPADPAVVMMQVGEGARGGWVAGARAPPPARACVCAWRGVGARSGWRGPPDCPRRPPASAASAAPQSARLHPLTRRPAPPPTPAPPPPAPNLPSQPPPPHPPPPDAR
jgi:hypothetical protein